MTQNMTDMPVGGPSPYMAPRICGSITITEDQQAQGSKQHLPTATRKAKQKPKSWICTLNPYLYPILP